MQGICSEIDGAVHNPAMGAWIVPCTATPNVEVIMGNQKFPIHPLDLTHVDTWETSGVDHTVCTSLLYARDIVIDGSFSHHYSFTHSERNFLISYSILFKLGL